MRECGSMTEVLLMQPSLPDRILPYKEDVVLCPPIGLCYVASTLLTHGFSVGVVDLAILDHEPAKVESEIRRAKPKILGITTSTCMYEKALKIARKAKEIDPRIVTVLGGPHVTFTATEALAHPEVDVVVRNEGEITMLELCKLYLKGEGGIDSIKGIAYRNENVVVNNPGRSLIRDLDQLPFPARRLLPLNLYRIPGTLITSRGCPSQCVFCAARAMSGGTYRTRSPGDVLAEIDEMRRGFNPAFYFIADDTFTVFHDRTREICAGLKKMGVKWLCESRANFVNMDLLRTMADSGCFAIQFGVESGSQVILNSIRKGITVDQVRNAAKWARQLDLLTVCSFMFPHPEDTLETIAETKRVMLELKSQGVVVFVSPTTPFPGTYLWDHATELGVRIVTSNLEDFDLATPILETRHLRIDQVSSIYEDLISISEMPEWQHLA
jgi:anaerobic magnesium-protoporphyrin IX monomethyl ester cyclase